ncbi:helix-turn-helix domain-containing protein [Sphingomonas sp. Leaf23]|uniref:helix-turn-helix domain-containing protein n=1 Tax=Sphingomonas sp. Leaf23 TaxID=1735689 RepID=UPI0009E65FD5|nr:helix-turn-helix domain-containing protein [Sphingomonas sp. Leaf23]
MQSHARTSPLISYRVNDAAHVLGISRRTIYRLIGSGKLRATKVGSATLIPADDVRALAGGA